MTGRQWQSVVIVVVIFLAAGGANLLLTVHTITVFKTSQQQQAQQVERKICTTLERIAELQPPQGNPRVNPSRGYDQRLHAAIEQLAPDLGCMP